ncbi:tetratricopeptide repeat protein [bacterium]|nr:MAG: tetratricopeptide repeat protein [bacterium]
MTLGALLLVLLLIAGAAGGVAYYMDRRGRGVVTRITPYTEGLHAILEADPMRAIQKLKETVAGDTSNIDAYIRLGTLYADTGDLPRAIKIHRSLTLRADLSAKQKLEVYRALAQDYIKAGEPTRTLESVNHILSQTKKDTWALEIKTNLLSSRGDWNGAFETAQKLNGIGTAASNRRLAVLKTMEGLRLCREGKERDGRIQFREAIKYDFSFVAPYLYWGDSYVREDRTEDAVKIWKRLLEVNSDKSYLVFERLETHLFELGRFSEIEQIYRKVNRDHPQNVHAYTALARFLEKRGDAGDAITVLRGGLEQNQNSLWLRRRLIQLFADVNDVEQVIEMVREVLSRVMEDHYEFTCSACGHISREPLWLCPKCSKLDTFGV